MKESYRKGVATRSGPESCVVVRKDGDEALTGESAGWVLSREIKTPTRKRRVLSGADALERGGRRNSLRRYREAQRDPTRSETPSMRGNTAHGNREIPWSSAAEGAADRIEKSKDDRR